MNGYAIVKSLEPPHPHCTISDVASLARDHGGDEYVVKALTLPFPLRPAAAERWPLAVYGDNDQPHRIRVVAAACDLEPYYVMEVVVGEPLARAIERGQRFSAAATAATLREIAASGTDDVQPRHVMMTPTGARTWNAGVAAWRRDAHALVAGTYTAGGHIVRHPNLTPDEAKGRGANPIVQLALLAYAMRAGTYYWRGDNDPDGAPMALLMEVMRGATDAASARAELPLGDAFDGWFAACMTGEIAALDAAAAGCPDGER